jgi:urease accessory protein
MALSARHHGRLSLELVCDQNRTIIARQGSHPPLQIFGLQYTADGAHPYLQIVNPCGGLFAGDTAEIDVTLHPGARLYLTTQAATKVYPAEQGGVTRQQTRLHVASDAILEYFPLPLLPFAQARYTQEMSIRVEPGGVCLVADVLAPGRMAHGERFAYQMVRSRVEGWVGEQLVLFDQMILEPQRRAYEGLGLLDGQPYLGTLYVLTSMSLEELIPGWNRQLLQRYGETIGITALAHGGLMARCLGDTSQGVLRRLDAVHRLIREEGLRLAPLEVYRPFA